MEHVEGGTKQQWRVPPSTRLHSASILRLPWALSSAHPSQPLLLKLALRAQWTGGNRLAAAAEAGPGGLCPHALRCGRTGGKGGDSSHLSLGANHGGSLGHAAERLAQVAAATHKGDSEFTLVGVVVFVGHRQHLRLVN
eukprot:scaffold8344_cov68-Isochrysis_galbana.AAC.1